jgi:acetyl-CoA acetyltransferase
MDMAQLYDAFTINTILFLEDLGFCRKGEGGSFVQGGAIAPGGRLAVNTNGGGLSCVHPGMYGVFLLIEAVRQLRGQAGQRQLARHRTAVVHGNGGTLSSQATAVLGTRRHSKPRPLRVIPGRAPAFRCRPASARSRTGFFLTDSSC